jgi:hypothetical protein
MLNFLSRRIGKYRWCRKIRRFDCQSHLTAKCVKYPSNFKIFYPGESVSTGGVGKSRPLRGRGKKAAIISVLEGAEIEHIYIYIHMLFNEGWGICTICSGSGGGGGIRVRILESSQLTHVEGFKHLSTSLF